jgi:hypothetical protein
MQAPSRRLLLAGVKSMIVVGRELSAAMNGSLADHLGAVERKSALRDQQLSFSRLYVGNPYGRPNRPPMPT